MMTRLVTDRLMMRRAQPSDVDDYHRIVSDYGVVKWTASWPWPAEIAHTTERCKPFNPELGMVGPVFHQSKMVGMMGIGSHYEDGPELGYIFAPEHWGKGYATEMARALIDHCWARYDWDVIGACAYDDNPASVRVLEKLGFSETAPAMGACKARGGTFPMRCYRLPRPPRI